MSSAITFYFKEIFPTVYTFIQYLIKYDIANIRDTETFIFAKYVYKILYRRYHNSNIQYDTVEAFKNDFANVLEDNFTKYKQQLDLIKKMQNFTEDDIVRISSAIANQANNPNNKPDDPTKPLGYISAQASTFANDNKFQAYIRAINNIPTQLIDTMLRRCVNLFKTIIPNQVYVYNDKKGD